MGRHHDMDIARAKGLLYVGTDDLNRRLTTGQDDLRTGDMVRIISEGVRGMLYKV